MTLSDKTKHRLDTLFKELWNNRTGVTGSWGASAFDYHPTYIHRGCLLLEGEYGFSTLYVLPEGCVVNPREGDPRARSSTFPDTSKAPIRVTSVDDGPWWALLEAELALMEQELQQSQEARAADKEAKRAQEELNRNQELSHAASAVSAQLKKFAA